MNDISSRNFVHYYYVYIGHDKIVQRTYALVITLDFLFLSGRLYTRESSHNVIFEGDTDIEVN